MNAHDDSHQPAKDMFFYFGILSIIFCILPIGVMKSTVTTGNLKVTSTWTNSDFSTMKAGHFRRNVETLLNQSLKIFS